MENFCYLIDTIKAIIWREFDSVATKIRIRQCKFREEVSFLVCKILPLKAKGRLYSPCFFFFSILYFTSIYNVHLKIYNSSINMFTHWLKSTGGKCRDRFRIPSHIKTSFNGNNPVNNFAKMLCIRRLTKNILNNCFVIFWWVMSFLIFLKKM